MLNNLNLKQMKTVKFKQTGYGQWNASTEHYGKEISIHFTSAPIYDLITSQERGYLTAIRKLRSRIINAHKN
jgi:hypothetical protein